MRSTIPIGWLSDENVGLAPSWTNYGREIDEETDQNPRNPDAESKVAAEELLAGTVDGTGVEGTALRMSTNYVVKRIFVVAFASVALLGLAPVIAVIAVAIKCDSPRPVLYSQDRTAELVISLLSPSSGPGSPKPKPERNSPRTTLAGATRA